MHTKYEQLVTPPLCVRATEMDMSRSEADEDEPKVPAEDECEELHSGLCFGLEK